MNGLVKLLLKTLAVIIAAYILPGVTVTSFFVALVVGVVLAIINIFIRPLLILLTLPLTIMTLGLFSLVINAVLILLASKIVDGFDVAGFWWAVLFSIVLSLVNWVLHNFSSTNRSHGKRTTYLNH